MENKKTKLTISGTAKKSIKSIEIAKTQGKNSVVIQKPKNNFIKKGGSFRSSSNSTRPKSASSFNRGAPLKPTFGAKTPPITNDFEKRKLAEQRATKRLKGENEGKKLKSGTKKDNETISKECIQMVRDKIGPVAAFKVAIVIKRLPKTRSGKILRGTIRKIADNTEYKIPPTIDDPIILDEIKEDLIKNKILKNV